MDQLFEAVAEKCKPAGFLESVISKAHYASEDRELIFDILEKILKCMEEGAVWSGKDMERDLAQGARGIGGTAQVQEVVITLGDGVDKLQEEYLSACQLTEAYMVEVLGSEILLLAYAAYNTWIREHLDFAVKRYYFLGTGEYVTITGEDMDREHSGEEKRAETDTGISLKLSALPDMLKRSGLAVTCTEGYCMLPKKTVAFYAELTADHDTVCEGICMGCGRTDCPNRMDIGERTRGNRTLDRPLTYGYSRIFGL